MIPAPVLVLAVLMLYNDNADRRHYIPKMSFEVLDWPEYEAGLRRRGSLTLWIEDPALQRPDAPTTCEK
jgi:hypothetical protein